MNLMLKSVKVMVVASMILQPLSVMASDDVKVTPLIIPTTGGGGGKSIIATTPGDFNIKDIQQNNSDIFLKVLGDNKDLKTQDRQFLIGIKDKLNEMLGTLIAQKKSFKEMAQKSQTDSLALETYLGIVNQINQTNDMISAEMATNRVISRDSLPSSSPIKIGETEVSTVGFGDVNMVPLMNNVDEVRNSIIAEIKSTSVGVIFTKHKQPLSPGALTDPLKPNLSGLLILTRAEAEAIENEIKEALAITGGTEKIQRRSIESTVLLIKSFVSNYGTKEFLRFQNENDKARFANSYETITSAFFMRSYLRKRFAIPMGAIQTEEFKAKVLNWENFGYQPLKEALNSFNNQAALTPEELDSAFRNVSNFVELYDRKVTPVWGTTEKYQSTRGSEYSSPDSGFLNRINSAVTFVTGQRPTAEALLAVMRLTLADIREEIMIGRGDWDAMKSYHNARYRATDDSKTANNKLICQIDWTLPDAAVEGICKQMGLKKALRPVTNIPSSPIKIFSDLIGQYQNVQGTGRQEAMAKQQYLDATTRFGGSVEEKAKADGETTSEIFD